MFYLTLKPPFIFYLLAVVKLYVKQQITLDYDDANKKSLTSISFFFPSFSLPNVLCDPRDPIWGNDWSHSHWRWGFSGFSSAIRQMTGICIQPPATPQYHIYI